MDSLSGLKLVSNRALVAEFHGGGKCEEPLRRVEWENLRRERVGIASCDAFEECPRSVRTNIVLALSGYGSTRRQATDMQHYWL